MIPCVDTTLFIGIGMYYQGAGQVANNSFVTTDADNAITELQCVTSWGERPGAGQLIGVSGVDITTKPADPFDVTVGGESDPGYISVRLDQGQAVTTSFRGVYSCIIPAEDGTDTILHVGIYPQGFNGMWIEQC